ncbi:hypothetical protein OAO01_06790, partial [Oligoflexia bacterium]|nr:hypothetical protein [Oligoflexia bacterium]
TPVQTWYLYAYNAAGIPVIRNKIVKPLGVLAADINGDGKDDIGYYRRWKKSRRIVFFVKGVALDFDLPRFKAIGTGQYKTLDGSFYDGVTFLDRSGNLTRMNFYDLVHEGVGVGLEGKTLLKSINTHLTGSASVPGAPPGTPGAENCDQTFDMNDGAGGALWKHSEQGGLVVLFPGRYKRAFDSVVVVKNGVVKGTLYFASWANADHEGDRQHWRHKSNPSTFPNYSTVVATDNGKKLCWTINKSGQRND